MSLIFSTSPTGTGDTFCIDSSMDDSASSMVSFSFILGIGYIQPSQVLSVCFEAFVLTSLNVKKLGHETCCDEITVTTYLDSAARFCCHLI